MARSIVVRLGSEESSFGFVRVEREKLYGKKERVVVDEAGAECQPAWLTPDGAVLVPNGGTAHVWMDERWDARENTERRAVDEQGKPLALVPSTLGVAQTLVEVDERRVLDHLTVNVYELLPEGLGETLRAALLAGKVFELPFNYKDDYEGERMFLVAGDDGFFGLIGKPTGFSPCERQVIVTDDAGADDLEGDLDFSML